MHLKKEKKEKIENAVSLAEVFLRTNIILNFVAFIKYFISVYPLPCFLQMPGSTHW